MPLVHLLSEDGFDDQIYVDVLEMLIGSKVKVGYGRLRPGGGIGEVRKMLPFFLAAIRRAGPVDDTYFVVAVDNDRAVEHSSHEIQQQHEQCRHCGLTAALHAAMPDGWPIPGAVAVPVQMIEAWLLLMHDPAKYVGESALPVCRSSDMASARALYGPNPPPQLKDLVEIERRASRATSKEEFALACVLKLDPNDLAQRSPSFRRFRDDVSKWPVG